MNQNTVSGNLDRIKRATDDMRLITGTTGEDIETVAQAVSDLNDDNLAKDETIAELEQEIEALTPSGSIEITNNGTTNVAGYQYADVNIPGPSGSIEITSNGTYDISSYASVIINVQEEPEPEPEPGVIPEPASDEIRIYIRAIDGNGEAMELEDPSTVYFQYRRSGLNNATILGCEEDSYGKKYALNIKMNQGGEFVLPTAQSQWFPADEMNCTYNVNTWSGLTQSNNNYVLYLSIGGPTECSVIDNQANDENYLNILEATQWVSMDQGIPNPNKNNGVYIDIITDAGPTDLGPGWVDPDDPGSYYDEETGEGIEQPQPPLVKYMRFYDGDGQELPAYFYMLDYFYLNEEHTTRRYSLSSVYPEYNLATIEINSVNDIIWADRFENISNVKFASNPGQEVADVIGNQLWFPFGTIMNESENRFTNISMDVEYSDGTTQNLFVIDLEPWDNYMMDQGWHVSWEIDANKEISKIILSGGDMEEGGNE